MATLQKEEKKERKILTEYIRIKINSHSRTMGNDISYLDSIYQIINHVSLDFAMLFVNGLDSQKNVKKLYEAFKTNQNINSFKFDVINERALWCTDGKPLDKV